MRTQPNLDALVEALLRNCGDLFDACRQVGLSPMFVNQWAKDDADVRDKLREAERVGALSLQSEAIRRAVQGVEKGVYFKGERVDTEIVYSDGLLTKLLAGRIPDVFGKEAEGGTNNTFNGPTQINIMPRANNYDEWLRMKESTLTARARNEALPAPDEVIDLVAVPVSAESPFAGIDL